MKKLLPILSVLFLISVGISQNKVNEETLLDKDGLMYHPETKELYSGKVFQNYLGGKPKIEGFYKDGERDGLWTSWYENGQKSFEGTFKNKKRDGLWTSWYENGRKKSEKTFNDGEEGLYTEWYPNGKLYNEKNYKNGNETFYFYDGGKYSESLYKNGLFIITEWYENGPKKFEIITNDVNGQDVSDTEWYENGQKSLEVLYDKNGKEISRKEWNKDGSVKE